MRFSLFHLPSLPPPPKHSPLASEKGGHDKDNYQRQRRVLFSATARSVWTPLWVLPTGHVQLEEHAMGALLASGQYEPSGHS